MNSRATSSRSAVEAVAAPDWRWRKAQRCAAARLPQRRGAGDDAIRAAAVYLRLRARGSAGSVVAAQRFPFVAAAERAWLDPPTRTRLMLLVMGNVPGEEIAELLGVDAETVALAELLFFDVRPALTATGWVHSVVIAATERQGDLELATKLKTAYCGGPVVARALTAAECRVPKEEAERIVAQELLLFAKLKAILDFPLSEQHQMEFVKMFTDYQLKRDALQLRKQQFAHRCEQDLRRHQARRARAVESAPHESTHPAAASAPPRAGVA